MFEASDQECKEYKKQEKYGLKSTFSPRSTHGSLSIPKLDKDKYKEYSECKEGDKDDDKDDDDKENGEGKRECEEMM
jgi:hypothetical protein